MINIRTNQKVFLKKILKDRNTASRETIQIVNRAATSVLTEVVRATPVDTGLARSNWVVSLGTGRADVIAPHSPGRKLGIAETTNASIAISMGSIVIAGRRRGVPIVITNSVYYISSLDRGSSPQQSAGFVDAAIRRGVSRLGRFGGNFRIFRGGI